MANLLPLILIGLTWGLSVAVGFFPFLMAEGAHIGIRLGALMLGLPLFALMFVLVGGTLSRIAQRGIVPGKFPREAMHPVYLMRRIYGACWTTLYYNKPLYSVILAVPFLKKLALRLYGYSGSTEFVVYPDTWIRDLPVLEVGKGAYLSNRATIGTNMCLSDGTIYVDRVKIKDGGLVGHLCMLAPGSRVLEKAEVGVGSAVGIKARVSENAKIGVNVTLNHGSQVESSAEVGTCSYIGLKAKIGANVRVPTGANIPAGAEVLTQDDVKKYMNSETSRLAEALQRAGGNLDSVA